jgi:lipid-binding SYLF domain-containing protein
MSRLLRSAVLVAAGLPLVSIAHAQDEKRQTECSQTVELFQKTDKGLDTYFDSAVGYAIFPSVCKGAFIVGGAAGSGCLYEAKAIVGETKLKQVTVGLQLGGQAYAEVIFFQTEEALASFKNGDFEMSAQVSAVAAASGASANAKYKLGVLVFTIAKGGLMYEASVGGQKFSYKPLSDSKESEKSDEDGEEQPPA